MKRNGLLLATLLFPLGLMVTESAQAEPVFNLSGFGTLGVTHSDNKVIDFSGSLFSPNGAGATHSTALSGETNVGVQGSADFGNGLSGVVQVVSAIRHDNSYQPKFEWVNLKYQATDDTQVRVGRVIVPMFMTSENRNVGYSLTPVRTPWDVYSQNPLSHVDGVNAGTRFNIGNDLLSLAVTGGRINDQILVGRVTGSGVAGNATYEVGASTFNFGYTKYKLNLSMGQMTQYQSMIAMPKVNPLTGQLTTLGAVVGYPVPNIQTDNLRGYALDLGYTYDQENWIVQGEYIKRTSSGPAIPLASAWSMMAGYRINKFTPYVSYSKITTKLQSLDHGPAQIPAQLASAFAACQQGLLPAATCLGNGTPSNPGIITQYTQLATVARTINTIDTLMQSRKYGQNTVSIGVRYDFYKNLDIKAQYDRISKPAGSNGQFVTPGVGSYPASWTNNSQTVNLLTVSLDFVF